MKYERLMYEGEGSFRTAPVSAEFAPVERLIALYRVPEAIRTLASAALTALRGHERKGQTGLIAKKARAS